MTLAYLLELVASLAFGLLLARGWVDGPDFRTWFSLTLRSFRLTYPTYSFFTGVILVQTVGLWAERARCRGPAPWGIGRMIWSTLGAVCLLGWAWDTGWSYLRQRSDPTANQDTLWRLALLGSTGCQYLAWLPLAVVLTARLAGRPGDQRPDGREWAGRLFGSLLLAVFVLNEVYLLCYRGGVKSWWRH